MSLGALSWRGTFLTYQQTNTVRPQQARHVPQLKPASAWQAADKGLTQRVGLLRVVHI